MRTIITITITSIFATLILLGCNDKSDEKKPESAAVQLENISNNGIRDTTSTRVATEKEEPANLTCKLFFMGFDFTDEETGETTKGEVSERKDFYKKKAYTFCYDSESFHQLTLNGKGKHLSFYISSGKQQVYRKEDFELADKLNFSSKDFSFEMGKTYSITIKQRDSIIFDGKIDSQGCM